MADEDKDEKKTDVKDEIEAMLGALGDPGPVDHSEDEDDKDKDKDKDKDLDKDKDKDLDDKDLDDKDKDKDKDDEDQDLDKDLDKDKDKDKDDDETDKDTIIANLRARLNAEPEKREAPVKKEEPKKEDVKKEEPKEEPLTLDEQDFIGELDLDDLTRDKDALNKILNSVYTKGVADSKKIATEGVLRALPDIVKHNLSIITALKESSDKFYADNKDLVPFKRVVAAVFEEIAAKNPDKKYDELMSQVAPEARKRLELHKNAVKGDDKEKDKLPRLPGKKGNLRQKSDKPNTSSLQSEIDEMNTTLSRR